MASLGLGESSSPRHHPCPPIISMCHQGQLDTRGCADCRACAWQCTQVQASPPCLVQTHWQTTWGWLPQADCVVSSLPVSLSVSLSSGWQLEPVEQMVSLWARLHSLAEPRVL
jgi:hypothetical protein